ncbi:MAG: hypothetical protein A3K18_21125 [Lentisphaerae bacterium RIFOXYA12_64_32]|nr:MAG: hypothetical protein A3K18_21125 [Lentisphaerae bacterium RIFOXYA12_64_32]
MKTTNIILLVSALVIAGLTTAAVRFLPGKAKVENPAATDPFTHGWKMFRMAEFSAAEKAFEQARRAAKSGTEAMTQALYGLALVNWLRTPDSDKVKAKAFFEQIIREFPEHDLAVWSQLALVRMRHVVPVGETPDYAAVCVDYEAIYAAHPGHPAAMEAFAYAQEARMISFKPEDVRAAVAALQAFVQTNPDLHFTSWVWDLLARGYRILDDGDAQLNAKLMVLKTKELDPSNPRMDNSNLYWEIATLAQFEVGDLATAKEFYQKLRTEYPRDMRNFAARRNLESIDKIEKGETAIE